MLPKGVSFFSMNLQGRQHSKGMIELGFFHSNVGARRGLESGVSGNAALKIDKRLRVVDQSGAFRCIRAGDPAWSRGAAYVGETPGISLKLHPNIATGSSMDLLPKDVVQDFQRFIVLPFGFP